MKTISMLELRKNTRGVVDGLAQGQSYKITYRNRPVGELRPVTTETAVTEEDPVYRAWELAEDLKGGLTAEDADRTVYEE